MHEIDISKIVINIGTQDDDQRQVGSKRLLEMISARKPTDALAKKRLPEFKIVAGKKIGSYVTIRGEAAKPILAKLIVAADRRIKERSITENTVSFGVKEYIDIQGIKYDPKIGMMGMNVNITFERKGMRVKHRKIKNSHVPKKHSVIAKKDIAEYLIKNFNVRTGEE
jgi:large subunit ribosomal protein L5